MKGVYYIYYLRRLIVKIAAVGSTKNYPSIAFQAKIFDGHAHLGKIGGTDYNISNLDKFVKSPLNIKVDDVKSVDTIDKMVVSSGYAIIGEADEIAGNEKVLEMIKGRKEYVPIAVCQPNRTNGDTSKIKQLLEKHPEFSGLKFHPTYLTMDNEAKYIDAYLPYMKLAEEKKYPCFFHCQGGQADAYKIYELAKKTPKVPVILGHAGALEGDTKINREHAIEVFEKSLKNKDANIHLDLSWVDWTTDGYPQRNQVDATRILRIAKEHNATDKILFGTDAPMGCFSESKFNNKQCYEETVGSFKQTIKFVFGKDSAKVTDQIFYDNANRLYCKKSPVKPINPWLKKGGIAAAVAAVGFGIYEACKIANQDNNSKIGKKVKARIK